MDAIKSQRTTISNNSAKESTRIYRPSIMEITIGIANNTKRGFGNLILNESGHGGIYSLLLQIVMVLTAMLGFVLLKLSAEIYYYLILLIPLLLIFKLIGLISENTAITLIKKPVNEDCNCDHCKYRINS